MPLEYPLVPGHEIAGRIEAVGEDVVPWEVGQRVGVGWFGGNCGHCDPCRRGDMISCVNGQVPGIAYDGGYADHVIVPEGALASIPDDLSAEDAGPLLCAGITTFNSLRESGARPGDLVAILGIGGLGHLGVQFAAGWASRPWPSRAGPTSATRRSRSAPTTTSTPRRGRLGRSCRSSAARRRSSPR